MPLQYFDQVLIIEDVNMRPFPIHALRMIMLESRRILDLVLGDLLRVLNELLRISELHSIGVHNRLMELIRRLNEDPCEAEETQKLKLKLKLAYPHIPQYAAKHCKAPKRIPKYYRISQPISKKFNSFKRISTHPKASQHIRTS